MNLETTRRLKQAKKGTKVVHEVINVIPEETIFIVMDMWDQHWCKDVNRKSESLAIRINDVLKRVRDQGIKVLHMPADCMQFYDLFPQRSKMINEPKKKTSRSIFKGKSHNILLDGGFFPVQMSKEGGCPCEPVCQNEMVWKKQHECIEIKEDDLISDHPLEVYSYLLNHKIKNIVYAGVHANVCLMKRPLGIRKMVKRGMNCFLCSDLTDIMYNLRTPPKVTHEEALQIVIEYIELRLCPTILSSEL